MAFTVSDFNDLLHLLAENPQWQAELRRHIISEDFAALPGIVRELAEAHKHAEQRQAGAEDRLDRVERRLEKVEQRLEKVEQRLEHVERRLEKVEQRLDRLEEVVQELVRVQLLMERRLTRVEDKLGELDGSVLEMQFDRKAPAYFGRWLRRPRVISHEQLWDRLEPHLNAEERQDALLIDLVVEGRRRDEPEAPLCYLTVEVSSVCDSSDVKRAVRRAKLFRQAGLSALPAVAGRSITETALAVAQEQGVVVVDDGRGRCWDEAMAKWPLDSAE